MLDFIQQLVSGIALGCVYGLIALGFVLIYKATEVVNFAQGDLMMLGGFFVFTFIGLMGLDYWLGFLFAVFRSRPSPFYVMDEVEAALDEPNLYRFLALIQEFRQDAQLLIVSHQKRTMEVADALYGVTMRGDGVTEVISQRLREAETV